MFKEIQIKEDLASLNLHKLQLIALFIDSWQDQLVIDRRTDSVKSNKTAI